MAGESYRRNPEYLRRKQQLHDALMRSAERAIPGITESVVYSESATPITHERFVRSTGGTSYGLAATPDQMLLKRPAARTAIKGLWIVGASTRYMHGISGTLGGGMLTAASIADVPVSQLRRLRLPDVWRPEPEFHLPQRASRS